MKSYLKLILSALLILINLKQSQAQQSIYYQKAKDLCLQAASKAKCPEQAAHYRKMANWNQCMIDQLAGKNVKCTEVSGPVPICKETQNGESGAPASDNSSTSKTQENTTKSGEKIVAAGTLLDKNSSQEEMANSLDVLLGKPVGTTNTSLAISDVLEGKQKKENRTAELEKSYKKLKYLFNSLYNVDYDQYILSIKQGDYYKWKSLYKPEININTVLIHNLPSSFSYLYLGNIALVSAYYGNFEFLQKLLTEFPDVGLNYKSNRFEFCEALEVAIISGRIDILKLLLDNGATIFYKPGFKMNSYEEWAKDLGNFEMAAVLKEYREKKERKIGKYFNEQYIGWDDDNIEYLVKKLRNPGDKLDHGWGEKRFLLPKNEPEKNNNKSETAVKISIADEIKKLKELLDTGTITKDEFETAKKKLLERN